MAMTGGIQLIDAFRYSGQRFLDLRQHCATIADLVATPETSIPDGFTKYCDESKCWYEWNSHNDIDPETGRWRKSVPINEVLTEEYIFAIVDADGTFLFGITHRGEVVYDKGIPSEVKPILRRLNRVLSETRVRLSVAEKSISEMKERLSELDGYKLMENENFIFAIMDEGEEHLLFGIAHDGSVVFDKGIPGEVQTRFDELKGYQIMHDENFIFAMTDNLGNLLFGIENTGHAVIPRGIVEVTTWEDYSKREPHPDTLYVIEGKGGRIDGAYINGRALSAGEEYAFIREGNLLMYHGRMSSLPRIWIDYEAMQLMIDYPSDYSGPLFMVEDGMLFLI